MVSHPFLPVLRTWLSCIVSFRPSQIRSRSRSSGAHPTLHLAVSSQMFAHAFRSLSFPSGLELNYSASVLSFPFVHRFCLAACFLGFSVPLSLPCFSPYFRPGFPCLLSGFKYSAFCSFPFVLPCFAPTAVPQVLPFWISPRGSMPDFRFLSSASILASHYSAICSSFSTFFPFLPHRWLPRCFCSALASQILPLLSGLVSRAFFPVLCTRLSVSFLSSYPASLPQLFHR